MSITTLLQPRVQVLSTARINTGAIFDLSGGKINIDARTYIDHGVILRGLNGAVEVGDNCTVNAYTILLGGGYLRIGYNTRIAPHTVIVPSNYVSRTQTFRSRIKVCAKRAT